MICEPSTWRNINDFTSAAAFLSASLAINPKINILHSFYFNIRRWNDEKNKHRHTSKVAETHWNTHKHANKRMHTNIRRKWNRNSCLIAGYWFILNNNVYILIIRNDICQECISIYLHTMRLAVVFFWFCFLIDVVVVGAVFFSRYIRDHIRLVAFLPPSLSTTLHTPRGRWFEFVPKMIIYIFAQQLRTWQNSLLHNCYIREWHWQKTKKKKE